VELSPLRHYAELLHYAQEIHLHPPFKPRLNPGNKYVQYCLQKKFLPG